ncbi:unnamed protein product [Periconia digitata]|uniref:Heterokaryon incompatibility domain-containing protein n=1 Tax=Periconia digitata TaxID=1303443 RepID=A0A9W4UM62_9PLEO|nr:unnamed protein product [Periconia digitata]
MLGWLGKFVQSPGIIGSANTLTGLHYCCLATFNCLSVYVPIPFIYPPWRTHFTMRLINCHTFQIEEFPEHKKPRYAILSHTSKVPSIITKPASDVKEEVKVPESQIITKACDIALGHGCDYCWVDTVCVNRSDSGDWSEAVNSMFKWYQDATFCIAYLNDFEGIGLSGESVGNANASFESKAGLDKEAEPPAYSEVDQTYSLANLGRCDWFSSGWTLTHLIAPRHVQFYDSQWRFYKEKREFATEISRITRIPVQVLKSANYNCHRYSVAEIMSWASRRRTDRIEDLSYCLFGLFDVNLPLIYGEGHKAFRRLQEEIIRTRADLSVFAWQSKIADKDLPPHERIRGILARSPSEFSQASGIPASIQSRTPGFRMTNKGLQIDAAIGAGTPEALEIGFLPLGCKRYIGEDLHWLGVFLMQSHGYVFRVRCGELGTQPAEVMRNKKLLPSGESIQTTVLKDTTEISEETLNMLASTVPRNPFRVSSERLIRKAARNTPIAVYHECAVNFLLFLYAFCSVKSSTFPPFLCHLTDPLFLSKGRENVSLSKMAYPNFDSCPRRRGVFDHHSSSYATYPPQMCTPGSSTVPPCDFGCECNNDSSPRPFHSHHQSDVPPYYQPYQRIPHETPYPPVVHHHHQHFASPEHHALHPPVMSPRGLYPTYSPYSHPVSHPHGYSAPLASPPTPVSSFPSSRRCSSSSRTAEHSFAPSARSGMNRESSYTHGTKRANVYSPHPDYDYAPSNYRSIREGGSEGMRAFMEARGLRDWEPSDVAEAERLLGEYEELDARIRGVGRNDKNMHGCDEAGTAEQSNEEESVQVGDNDGPEENRGEKPKDSKERNKKGRWGQDEEPRPVSRVETLSEASSFDDEEVARRNNSAPDHHHQDLQTSSATLENTNEVVATDCDPSQPPPPPPPPPEAPSPPPAVLSSPSPSPSTQTSSESEEDNTYAETASTNNTATESLHHEDYHQPAPPASIRSPSPLYDAPGPMQRYTSPSPPPRSWPQSPPPPASREWNEEDVDLYSSSDEYISARQRATTKDDYINPDSSSSSSSSLASFDDDVFCVALN